MIHYKLFKQSLKTIKNNTNQSTIPIIDSYLHLLQTVMCDINDEIPTFMYEPSFSPYTNAKQLYATLINNKKYKTGA